MSRSGDFNRRRELHESLRAFVASGLPVTPALAGAMLHVFKRFGQRPPPGERHELTSREHAALECTAAGWPMDRIVAYLDLPIDAVEVELGSSVDKLDQKIDPGRDDFGSGDRAPRPGPRGGLPGRTAARPLPAADDELLTRFESYLRAFPADWAAQHGER